MFLPVTPKLTKCIILCFYNSQGLLRAHLNSQLVGPLRSIIELQNRHMDLVDHFYSFVQHMLISVDCSVSLKVESLQ